MPSMLCLILALVCLSVPDAQAQDIPQGWGTGVKLAGCDQSITFSQGSITAPIVACVQSTIENSVTSALQIMSDYFAYTTIAVMTLALVMHGAQMLAGERGINGKSMLVMVKIAFVGYFCYNLGGFAGYLFGIMDQVLSIVLGGYSPWQMIDNLLGTLFGFTPGIAMSQGLSWLVMSFSSGSPNSGGMSFAIVTAFIELILFIVEIVYIFLSCYLIMAFMIIMSPMFVPMILFQMSERYFRKWLDMIISSIMLPVLLFATLSFALALYIPLICNVFTIMLPSYNCIIPLNASNPPDFSPFWKTSQPLYSLTTGTDSNFTNTIDSTLKTAPGDLINVPGAATTINPFNRGSFDMNTFRRPGVNFGRHDKTISTQVMFAFISLWIYTMLLKRLIEKMPEVAQEIASVGMGIVLRGPKMSEKIAELKADLAGGAATGAGAIAGGQGGKTISGTARGQQMGAIGGGIIGHVLARRAL